MSNDERSKPTERDSVSDASAKSPAAGAREEGALSPPPPPPEALADTEEDDELASLPAYVPTRPAASPQAAQPARPPAPAEELAELDLAKKSPAERQLAEAREEASAERPHIQMLDLTVKVGGRVLYERVNLGIRRGEVALLVGGSGTGKSVLIKILLGLITRETPGFEIEGKLLVGGVDVLRPGGARRVRRDVGIVFQDYALFDELSARENLEFAFDHSPATPSRAERERLTDELVETLSLNLHTPISRMSGGERRRLAIARTLAYDPQVVLFDEPTTGLDPLNAERVATLIGRASTHFGKTAIVVTHDYEYLRDIGERVLLLDPERHTIVDLPPERANVEEVKERLAHLKPPPPAPATPLRDLLHGAGGFFALTTRVLERAVAVPASVLAWPFTTGLVVIGAALTFLLFLRGASEVATQPERGVPILAVLLLGTGLWLAHDVLQRRYAAAVRTGAWLLGGLAVAALAHVWLAGWLGRSLLGAPDVAEGLAARVGAGPAWLFAGIALLGLVLLVRLLRYRAVTTVLSVGAGLAIAGWGAVQAVRHAQVELALATQYAFEVPAWRDEFAFPFLAPWLIFAGLGLAGLAAAIYAPRVTAQQRWSAHYFGHFSRVVTFSSALPYLAAAGFITGFVGTYFVYRYFPFRDYTEPLIIDDILKAIGFVLFRVLIPLVGSVLIAARCGAAVTADVGNRVYTHQEDALRTFQANPTGYWSRNVLWSFLMGGPLLIGVAFLMAAVASMIAFIVVHPDSTPSYWYLYFTWEIRDRAGDSLWPRDFAWLAAKVLICSAGTAVITTSLAMRPKESSVSVSRAITQTILWATLYVLVVHLVFAFFEFRELRPPERTPLR